MLVVINGDIKTNMSWTIYKHTNLRNGKVYIGQTKQPPKYRYGPEGRKYTKDNLKFYNAIQKLKREDIHAWDNLIEHKDIETGIQTQEEADEREKYWIAYYDSYKNGYNMTKGGRDGEYLGIPIYQINIKTLEIIKEHSSAAEAARSLGKRFCSPISACCFGTQISAFGYYWCKKVSYFKGWNPRSNKNMRPVYKIDKKTIKVLKEYSSLNEAINEHGTAAIGACCRREISESVGFYWCFASDYNDDWKPVKNNHKKQVVQMDRGLNIINIFDSIIEASEKTRTSPTSIVACCKKTI